MKLSCQANKLLASFGLKWLPGIGKRRTDDQARLNVHIVNTKHKQGAKKNISSGRSKFIREIIRQIGTATEAEAFLGYLKLLLYQLLYI